jgi:glycosyltransferase involved in cell wall biosynthesis
VKITICTSLPTPELTTGGAIRLNAFVKALESYGIQPAFTSIRKPRGATYAPHLVEEILAVRALSTDLTYVYVQNPTMSLLADLVKLGTQKKVICHLGSPFLQRVSSLRGTSFSWRTFYQVMVNNSFWFRLYPKLSDAFIVNTVFQKKQLCRFRIDAEKICVMPPLVDRSVFYSREKSSSIMEMKLDPQYRYCTYVGHFTPAKGVEDLIIAFSRLAKLFSDVKLILAWSGFGSRKRIETLVQTHDLGQKVIWMGKVNVPKLLSASEMIILPYRHYVGTANPPSLVLEALCVGTPIVSTSVGCVPEFIKHGKSGMLALPKNPESLKNAIFSLLKNDGLIKRISINQIDMSIGFDMQKSMQPYVKLIEQVANDERR